MLESWQPPKSPNPLLLNIQASVATCAIFPAATCAKNRCGSTPLMLAAGGKCGNKLNRVLVDALLANGAGASAAEVSNR